MNRTPGYEYARKGNAGSCAAASCRFLAATFDRRNLTAFPIAIGVDSDDTRNLVNSREYDFPRKQGYDIARFSKSRGNDGLRGALQFLSPRPTCVLVMTLRHLSGIPMLQAVKKKCNHPGFFHFRQAGAELHRP